MTEVDSLGSVVVVLGAMALATAWAAFCVVRIRPVADMTAPPMVPTMLGGAALAAVTGLAAGPQWWLPALAVLAGGTAALTVTDFQYQRLPYAAMRPTAIACVALIAASVPLVDGGLRRLGMAVICAAVAGLLYVLLKLARPAGIGLGDVALIPLLAFVLGWFGWPFAIIGWFAAYLTAAVFVLVAMLFRRLGRRSYFALGPFLFLGCWVGILLAAPQG